MKNLSANYIISNEGTFLKNGIMVSTDDGIATETIDTMGNLKELPQLAFYNGILMQNFIFLKTDELIKSLDKRIGFLNIIFPDADKLKYINIEQFFEVCKHIQLQFSELKIPEIMQLLTSELEELSCFAKSHLEGIYLLKGVDLQNLQFKPNFSLKIINL
jgi:hypothetical protein